MNIAPISFFQNTNKIQNTYKSSRYNSNRFELSCDTVSFGMMKKSKFQGTDLAVINRYKAPIEKFNSNEDFQNWCKDKRKKDYNLPGFYMSPEYQASMERLDALEEWENYLNKGDNNFTEAQKLLIAEGVSSDLNDKKSMIPLPLDKDILKETMEDMDSRFKANKNLMLSFEAEYTKKLQEPYIKDIIPDKHRKNSGWLVIPQTKPFSKEYDENVKKLRLFSAKTWCTKSHKAPKYITKGSFHIYLDNLKPTMAVSYKDDEIAEIQNIKNDADISQKYIPSLLEHIEGEKFNFDTSLQHQAYLAKLNETKEN